jgi:hypothetical protein
MTGSDRSINIDRRRAVRAWVSRAEFQVANHMHISTTYWAPECESEARSHSATDIAGDYWFPRLIREKLFRIYHSREVRDGCEDDQSWAWAWEQQEKENIFFVIILPNEHHLGQVVRAFTHSRSSRNIQSTDQVQQVATNSSIPR